MKWQIQKESDLEKVAREIFSMTQPSSSRATILALYGELGAGKTAFVKKMGELLRVDEKITSPTFVIMKKYSARAVFRNLVHIDAYRLREGHELISLGIEDHFTDPSSIIFIEWPSIVENIIPEDAYRVIFSHEDNGGRLIEFTTPNEIHANT